MDRRAFLTILALAAAGCRAREEANAPAQASSSPALSGNLASATASSSPGVDVPPTSPGVDEWRAIVRRHLSFDADPEYSIWRLARDGSAKMLKVLPAKGSPVKTIGDLDVVCLVKEQKASLFTVAADGAFQALSERVLPASVVATYYLSEEDLVVGYGWDAKKSAAMVVSVPAKGAPDVVEASFKGVIRDFQGDGALWVAAPLGGSYAQEPLNIDLMKLHEGKWSRLLNAKIGQYVGTGYVLGYSFLKRDGRLLMSAGTMDTPHGDRLLIFEVGEKDLTLLQELEAGFRPPALSFDQSGTMAYLQDNSGNLHTFKEQGGKWVAAQTLALQSLATFLVASKDDRTLFTTNNPGDVVFLPLSAQGEMGEPTVFPALIRRVEGREPEDVQHDIVAVLS